jgi:predicted GNAT family acetyltransferase
MTEEIAVQNDGPAYCLTLSIDGRRAAFIDYYVFGEVAIVTHTEVSGGNEGQGLGTKIACRMLDRFDRTGYRVVPVCGFIAEQIRRHPQYAHLLTPCCRRIFAI